MKLKLLGIFFVSICLMSSTVFATYNWMQDPAYADNWTEPNQWDASAHAPPTTLKMYPTPPAPANGEIKMITNSGTGGTAHCTINSVIGSYTSVNTSVNGNLYINSGADIGFNRTGSKNGLRVGSNSAGGTGSFTGTVYQSAGTVTATNVYLGYAGSNLYDGVACASGNYVMSGGTLTASASLSVGTGINGSGAQTTAGIFTVDGASSTISVTALRVGGQDFSGTNSGTLEFKVNDGSGVSSIGCSSVNLDAGGANATTALIVSLIGAPPVGGTILLVNNTGAAVVGTFDTFNGGYALEGSWANIGSGVMAKLTYVGGTGNDIVLLVPEPATLALLGLGLLAIRRNKK
jgi:hypothetical protein